MIKPLIQRVLVAYDGTRPSLQAALYGIIMAKTYKCQLRVVYVVDTASIRQLTASKFFVRAEAEATEQQLAQDGARNLDYVVSLAKSKGVKIQTELLHGAVWSQVISSAENFGANLILLGGSTAGRSATEHNALGTSRREILNGAKCSVMVVHEPYVEQLFKLA